MPQPASLKTSAGALRIDEKFTIALTGHSEVRLDLAAERFLTQLHRQTALLLAKPTHDAAKATLMVHADHASKEVQELGEDESYSLEVTPSGAKLSAANPLACFAACKLFFSWSK